MGSRKKAILSAESAASDSRFSVALKGEKVGRRAPPYGVDLLTARWSYRSAFPTDPSWKASRAPQQSHSCPALPPRVSSSIEGETLMRSKSLFLFAALLVAATFVSTAVAQNSGDSATVAEIPRLTHEGSKAT